LETAWVNSVLALRGSEHPELVERVNRLLANVGNAKLSMLYEDELRRLGDDGVAPLLAYLASTAKSPGEKRRATAANIVADVAQARWIPDLIELLTDANADVRYHAARGLERLTARDQGCNPDTWKTEPWRTCQPAHEKWREWWAANRDRYPAAKAEIAAASAAPF
jgi:HEAT repeat protein